VFVFAKRMNMGKAIARAGTKIGVQQTINVDRLLRGLESCRGYDCNGSIAQVQVEGKRSAAPRAPPRLRPSAAAPRKADLRASAYRSANDCLVPVGVSTPAAGDRLQPLHSHHST